MCVPPMSRLKKMAEDIVTQAREDQTLSSLTPRLIRQKIEEKAELEAGTLDDKKYKGPIGEAIKAAQSSRVQKPSEAKKKDATSVSKQVEEEDTVSSGTSDKVLAKGKKRKSEEAKSTSRATTKTKAKNQTFKSAEFVPTSDIEPDEPNTSGNAGEAPSEGDDTETTKPPPKKRKKTAPKKAEPRSSPKPESGSSSKRPSSPTVVEDSKAESDMSDVVDELPKRKRQSNGKGKTKEKSEKPMKQKKTTVTLSKDEATIKRLKSFVNACGVRKVWSKVFEGEDQPSKQIRILKDILTDLGMTGRMSMEQAKVIKEKRDLAMELEDVQNFEKAVLRQGSRRSRKSTPAKEEKEDEERSDPSSGEAEDARPVKRKGNARQSIMAFLEDQSDSD
ncbi:hypothetical protein L218DRAFT_953751 [Marasmius fiardii PR-910]|nr:hypothetical protein L218DRAFT_953751 [Marasmius fiardii PR-910]